RSVARSGLGCSSRHNIRSARAEVINREAATGHEPVRRPVTRAGSGGGLAGDEGGGPATVLTEPREPRLSAWRRLLPRRNRRWTAPARRGSRCGPGGGCGALPTRRRENADSLGSLKALFPGFSCPSSLSDLRSDAGADHLDQPADAVIAIAETELGGRDAR